MRTPTVAYEVAEVAAAGWGWHHLHNPDGSAARLTFSSEDVPEFLYVGMEDLESASNVMREGAFS
eukprot:11154937-Lingulodinium_polyedra.AAC.1